MFKMDVERGHISKEETSAGYNIGLLRALSAVVRVPETFWHEQPLVTASNKHTIFASRRVEL
jgi:hypothetical protein